MNSYDFTMQKIESPLQWVRVFFLYRRVFPRSERKPFCIIRAMWRAGKTDVWCLQQNGRFAGFASTINDTSLILLDYLAVRKRMRGQGIGSCALEEFKRSYAGRGIFVEIESEYEAGPGRAERIRRKKFYTAGGMQPAGVMADVFGVKMELLCWNCRVDFPRYHAFYRDNYSAWAAEHIIEAAYPQGR